MHDKVSLASARPLPLPSFSQPPTCCCCRFGVKQREKLLQNLPAPPHMLLMTATPIPRTLALVTYGGLVLSTITQMPPGRSKVVTKVIVESDHARHQVSENYHVILSLPPLDCFCDCCHLIDCQNLMFDAHSSVSTTDKCFLVSLCSSYVRFRNVLIMLVFTLKHASVWDIRHASCWDLLCVGIWCLKSKHEPDCSTISLVCSLQQTNACVVKLGCPWILFTYTHFLHLTT